MDGDAPTLNRSQVQKGLFLMQNRSGYSRLLLTFVVFLATFALVGQAWADFSYTVQPGDNLSKIARNNNVTLAALIAANQAQFPCLTTTNGTCLQAGWVLVIPGAGGSTSVSSNPGNYTVLPGDSLARIALKFKVSFSALLKANAATHPCLASQTACALQIGWTLVIPGGFITTAPSSAQTPEAGVREYYAALNARDVARFKASLHPSLLAQSPDPDFDSRDFVDIVRGAQITFEVVGLRVDSVTADAAQVSFTERVSSPLANINGYQISLTFSLTKSGGRWLVADEGVERVELIP
jgi:LysM repeat protein